MLVTVYPRVGGGTLVVLHFTPAAIGLSPRVRGNRLERPQGAHSVGSIPAWAGEPVQSRIWFRVGRVYPRVGGGTRSVHPSPSRPTGLSPRGRGNLWLFHLFRISARSIPAWAGEPGSSSSRCRHRGGLSPRGRGNPDTSGHHAGCRGSIPAWAGEPRYQRPSCGMQRVYPRVGGGTAIKHYKANPDDGLSPRGRGNPGQTLVGAIRLGSIPAWAGEPVTPTRKVSTRGVYPRVGGGTF